MPVLILDPERAKEWRERYDSEDGSKYDEMWEGVLVVPPLPNDEHQEIQFNFALPLAAAVAEPRLGVVRMGVNVTDRHADWTTNFRGPDVVVYLNSNPAVNHGSHWVGGPDFLVEIISEGEDPHAKFDFYAAVNTREVLVVERNPWAVELFTLANGTLASAGRSEVANGLVLTSTALGLTLKLVAGTPRPKIEVTHPASGKGWVV